MLTGPARHRSHNVPGARLSHRGGALICRCFSLGGRKEGVWVCELLELHEGKKLRGFLFPF